MREFWGKRMFFKICMKIIFTTASPWISQGSTEGGRCSCACTESLSHRIISWALSICGRWSSHHKEKWHRRSHAWDPLWTRKGDLHFLQSSHHQLLPHSWDSRKFLLMFNRSQIWSRISSFCFLRCFWYQKAHTQVFPSPYLIFPLPSTR